MSTHNRSSIASLTAMLLPAVLVCVPLAARDVEEPDVDLSISHGGGEFTNSVGMKFVRVRAGKFPMGAAQGENGAQQEEMPQHEVEMTKEYFIGVTEVTQKQYETVIGKNPSNHAKTGANATSVQGLDTSGFPVENVSWHEAKEFAEKLNARAAEKQFRVKYRLPSEAEWEYACRGGHTVKDFGKKAELPFNVKVPSASLGFGDANFDSNNPFGGGKRGQMVNRPCKVGTHPANSLGVHDMHGNVWEWVADWHSPTIYSEKNRRDPTGPANGNQRILRGGSYFNEGHYLRAARRLPYGADQRTPAVGFRLAATPP